MRTAMTANPFAALLRDVPRYDGYGTFDPDGDVVRLSEVLAALAAVPADLAETAGDLLPTLRKGPGYVYRFVDTDNRAADLITSLLARIAAQEAQMKGLGEALVKINVGEGWAAQIARKALKEAGHEPT